jgi:hypothetical protein
MERLIVPLLVALPLLSQATPLSQSETQDLIRRIQAINGSKPSIEANFLEERHAAILKEEEMYDLEKRAILRDSLRALTAGLDFQQLNSF